MWRVHLPADSTGRARATGNRRYDRVMANRLATEQSPYLLQHAGNPVDWWPWGEPAFDEARRTGRPIFLSIGYATCHWCHVMEHESFEDPATAEMLNRDFVPVKLDREERPDVDRVYMTFVQATTGSGGWPMSVWLTPDLRAVLRRHLLSTDAAAWAAGVQGCAPRDCPGLARGADGHRRVGRGDCVAARRDQWRARRRRASRCQPPR